jgi:hypothetical protein
LIGELCSQSELPGVGDHRHAMVDQIGHEGREAIVTPNDGPHAMVRLLARVIGVGIETADMLVHEVLSRNMHDRRAIARYAGLIGSPDESGRKRRERPCSYACDGIPMTVRGGGFPTSPLAFMPIGRMGPPLRSFAADAHDCIVVLVLGPTAYKVVARFNRARKRAPL